MKDNFLFHFEDLDLEEMTDAEAGKLFKAVIAYATTGEAPDFDDRFMKSSFKRLAKRHDADAAAYADKCAQNSVNGAKGGRPKKTEENRTVVQKTERFLEKAKKADIDIDNDIDFEKKKAPTEPKKKSDQRFSPPTAEEVREYCREKALNNVDPQQFVDFYASKGWKVGNQPMKDWRAAARNWNGRQKSPPKNQFLQFEQHSYDMDELMKRAKRRTV